MAPKVSVIVPIYNVKQYLANSLDSIAEQKFDELEVLLIDDGSSDGSAEIAKAYAKRYPNDNVIEVMLGTTLQKIT